jgi:hypothetical protein
MIDQMDKQMRIDGAFKPQVCSGAGSASGDPFIDNASHSSRKEH